MIYYIKNKSLKVIKNAFQGELNDVYICKNINSEVKEYHTLLLIKDHNIAQSLLELFWIYKKSVRKGLESFGYGEHVCFLFPYEEERLLHRFYAKALYSKNDYKIICKNLVLTCITCNIPYPVLCLILKQQRIHLKKDNQVYFDYQLDMSFYDENDTQKECVILCAQLLKQMLDIKNKKDMISYQLLKRKIKKEAYSDFIELYKDICFVDRTKQKSYKLEQMKKIMYTVFLILCVAMGTLVFFMILFQLVWGDASFLRLFSNAFKTIGTESLLQ